MLHETYAPLNLTLDVGRSPFVRARGGRLVDHVGGDAFHLLADGQFSSLRQECCHLSSQSVACTNELVNDGLVAKG